FLRISQLTSILTRPMNVTDGTEFVLLGLTHHPELQVLLFIFFLLVYVIIIVGNAFIFTMIMIDPLLHTPMYFFLKVLSFLDICYSSVTLPQMLVNFLSEDKRISHTGCATQMFFLLFLGASECFLLAAMAYDRYIAICKPLRYRIIMNKTVCISFTILCWFIGNVVSLLQTLWVFSLPFCGSNQINYLFCDIPPLIKLSCIDTTLYEIHVLKMTSSEGRHRAFSTCSSHIMVVTLYYGSGSLIYLRPNSINVQDSNKVLALMYTTITPMLNPIIYSLRNKEVNGAIKRMMLKRKLFFSKR
uniref:Olfactory receptor n=1 Tax=Salvator merianae TaxID=96440 RepID=A0A8D0E4A7_SALMN